MKEKFIKNLKSKSVHVVGVSGAEGSAIALFLAKQAFKKVTLHDFCPKEDFKKNFFAFHDAFSYKEKEKLFNRIKRLPFRIYFRDNYLKNIKRAGIIFVPQSWFRYPLNEPLKALEGKIPFYNITKLYLNLSAAPIIGITGTSGKSTTARLVYEIFKKEFPNTYLSGNDRANMQILENIFDLSKDGFLILEISNRQLKIDLAKSPQLVIITNISPNHLDDHRSFTDYIRTKKSLLKYQTKDNFAILNYDNKVTREMASEIKSTPFFFSREEKLEEGAFLDGYDLVIRKNGIEYKICSTRELKIPGLHNVENVLAASSAAFLQGINTKIIRQVVTSFSGLKSRLELIRELRGVQYYEDSSSCNPDGVRCAVEAFERPKILIAGGARKKISPGEFDEMAKSIIENNVKLLLLIGERAEAIKEAVIKMLSKSRKPGPIVYCCSSLEMAVLKAKEAAKKGDIVILSPGCESFDMFKDYRDRARQFRRLVKALK